jgi:SAM-dependent methyltransferase
MTDWDEKYRLGDTPWEKGQPAPPLLELLELHGREIWGEGPVLVPGCGLGHDVRALAGIGVQALGLDLSPLAMEKARGFPHVGGEAYELGNFLDPAWRGGREFSALWEHTCFCAIDPAHRQAYAEAAAQLLKEGGLLAGVFFLTPFDPGEDSAGPPFATTIEELEQRFSPWFERVHGWVPQRAYPGREGREWIGLFRKLPNRSVAAEA